MMKLIDFVTCIWLLIPVFIWNAILYKKLPSEYQKEKWDRIPKGLEMSENILRIIVFMFPIILNIKIGSKIEILGLWIYLAGLLIYFLSWIMQIGFRNTSWSRSKLGFTAPAYTSIFFLTGISMIGNENVFHIKRLNLIYMICIAIFVILHTSHSNLVYKEKE